MILLDYLSHVDGTILSQSYARRFPKDKVGETCLFSFDESKRLLAVYASARVSPFPLSLPYAREPDVL
jgi:hypothetical protein